ncbi:MAG: TIGR01777 family oxidoreductase [Bacteroidetes bacterium]|nr:TIGR01777 family oxidoreductase [Bacteroidota bacterium]
MNKKIIITGATGSIGKILCKELIKRGDEVTIFTRNPAQAKSIIEGAKEYIKWNYETPEEWNNYLNGKNAVIHLAGVSIAGRRWNSIYKKLIFDSRIISTRNLVKAFEEVEQKPAIFISASAVGYYGNAEDDIVTESSKCGNDFLSQVCKAWELESEKVESFGTRRISIRTGIVLSANGALKRMLLPYKLFIGGPIGSGKQWFPWIHIDDLIRIYLYALDNPGISGIINASSPKPVTMKEFASTLGKILHRPSLFSVPLFALRIAIGEAAESVAASQRAIPEKLLESGFKFKFENVEDALKNILE